MPGAQRDHRENRSRQRARRPQRALESCPFGNPEDRSQEWERFLSRECAGTHLPLGLRRNDDSYSNLKIELIDVFLGKDMRRPEENLAAVNDLQLA